MDSSRFPLRGAVEGFYGAFYTFPERNDLIRFLGEHGFNFYLYGPKNDRQHRMRWWDPYPPAVLDEFETCIRIAQEVGVRFCYAISFGVPMNYASQRDSDVVTAKLRSFFDRGCRAFAVLLDDITDGFVHEVNQRNFATVADAHADTCNRLLEWARGLDDSCRLYLCQSEYCGTPPFSSYLADLCAKLDTDIPLFYTGPSICSRTITVDDVRAFTQVTGRKPIIWDNYPANDLQMRPEMHVGPLQGRDEELWRVSAGYVANLMNQAEASKIALLTVADYLKDPIHYDPWRSWEPALLQVAGDDSYQPLHLFAENSLGSPLRDEDAPRMTSLITAAMEDLRGGAPANDTPTLADLTAYFDVLDEACYYLKYRMGNLALRQNLLPWIEALEDRFWMGRGAVRILRAVDDGSDVSPSLRFTEELLTETRGNPKRVGGKMPFTLAEYAVEQARRRRLDGLPQLASSQAPATGAELDSGAGTDLNPGPQSSTRPAA